MTDYNDGKWHGWNGGTWPEGVHQNSMVEAYYRIDAYEDDLTIQGAFAAGAAYGRSWPDIVAFRVVKPYREPRVIWVNEYSSGALAPHADEQTAKLFAAQGTLPALRIAVRYVEQPE